MKKLLLREFNTFEKSESLLEQHLSETEKANMKSGKEYYVVSVIQAADTLNGNGRVYPRRVLEREIENYKKMINEGRSYGENNHSDSDQIDVNNISHLIKDIWWEGNNVMAKIKILSGAPGQHLRSLLEDGVKIGMSSRAIGSLREEEGRYIVEDDLAIICWDVVANPSTPNAFMIKESRTPINKIFERGDILYRIMNDILE